MLLVWMSDHLWGVGVACRTLRGAIIFPDSASIVGPVFLIHAAILFFSFDRKAVGATSAPLFNVTSRGIRMAKVCLGLAVAYFIFWLILMWGTFLTTGELVQG